MKLVKTLAYAVILSLPLASYVEAKGKSFSGGFRAQRTAPAPAAKPAQPLNMSKDLNGNAASGSALKTGDGRTATGSESGWFRSGGAAKPAQPAAAPSAAAAPAAARQSGGFMNNIMWFMLGSSLASHVTAKPEATAEQTAGQSSQVQVPVSEAGLTDPAVVPPPGAGQESLLMTLLRIVLWGTIFYGIYRLAKSLMRPSKKPNYTLGNH